MDDDILLPDCGKAIAIMFADPLGETRCIRWEFQIRPVFFDQLSQIRDAKKPAGFSDGRIGAAQFLADQPLKFVGHRAFNLEPDDAPASAPLYCAAEIADEIFCFFLDLNVAVTNDAEGG